TVTLDLSGAVGTFATRNVGNGIAVAISGLTVNGADVANYSLSQPSASANITTRGLTVSGITAANKPYDRSTSATIDTGGASLQGVISGDTVTLDVSGGVGTFATRNVGNGIAVAISGLSIGGADVGNYSLSQPNTSANITAKGLTVYGITASNSEERRVGNEDK